MYKEVIVIGAGGHGNVVADIIKKSGDRFVGFLDDDVSKKNVIDKIDNCTKYLDKHFVIAIGDNEIRKRIIEEYSDLKYYTAIHSTAVISESAEIGRGTVVMANAVVNSEAKIGNHCIINTASVVEHNDLIKDYVHVSPGAVLCGNVKIGEGTHIGAACVVRNNINICSNVVIGCGGVVVKDICIPGVYIGIPVSKIR